MMEIKIVPNTDIINGLDKVLHSYVDMNDGDPEKSKFINQVIKGLKADISKVCNANRPDIEVWTNASQKRGFLNWPDVPWIAFGGPNFFSDDTLSFSLNINFQWPANKSGVYLTILPFAIEWHRRFPVNAKKVFEPYRNRFVDMLAHLKEEKFSFDKNIDPGTSSVVAVHMADMYIVHKFYPIDKLPSEESIQKDILVALDAQQRLIRPNGPILWNVTIPTLEKSEEEMFSTFSMYGVILYGDPQFKGKDLPKLWGCPTTDPATRTDLTTEMQKMGLDGWKGDGIWAFIKRMREGDLVNVQNEKGDTVYNGIITSKCQYVEDSRIPLLRNVKWAEIRGPTSIIDPSKAVLLPRLI